jgi:hypothetical protein
VTSRSRPLVGCFDDDEEEECPTLVGQLCIVYCAKYCCALVTEDEQYSHDGLFV